MKNFELGLEQKFYVALTFIFMLAEIDLPIKKKDNKWSII